MMDAVIAGAVVTGGAVVAAAVYAYVTGNDASVDVDGDGEGELEFEGSDTTDCDGDTKKIDDDGGTETLEVPPADVREIGTELTAVKGIGDTRADALEEDGFYTAADLYFASDDELADVHGIGELTVSQIRDDIGSAD
jgi:predicted flap endonuclease-1-like 5' DNA nuclease